MVIPAYKVEHSCHRLVIMIGVDYNLIIRATTTAAFSSSSSSTPVDHNPQMTMHQHNSNNNLLHQ